MAQLEGARQDKDGLHQLANDLRGKSTESQLPDVDDKTAVAEEKFSQLEDTITNRYVFFCTSNV